MKIKPKSLYHYTDIDAFKNIITSKKVRATHYSQLNDHSEIEVGIEKLSQAIEKHPVNKSDIEYKDFLLKGIDSFRERKLKIYVFSLSSVADTLEQWRAYAPNGGVAIGFDFEKVSKGFLCDISSRSIGREVENPIRHDPANRLRPCIYTNKHGNINLKKIVEERFFKPNSYPRIFKQAGLETPWQKIMLGTFQASLSVMIYSTICSIKHGAYKAEKEWRCVNFRPDPKKYPEKLSDSNKLFIEMKFNPDEFIKEVWISPHGDKEGFERAVTYMKEKLDLSYKIERSLIPYRNS